MLTAKKQTNEQKYLIWKNGLKTWQIIKQQESLMSAVTSPLGMFVYFASDQRFIGYIVCLGRGHES